VCEGEGDRERERRKEGRNGIINVLELECLEQMCVRAREGEREMEFFNENSNQQLFLSILSHTKVLFIVTTTRKPPFYNPL
jgi:hypothetical protein